MATFTRYFHQYSCRLSLVALAAAGLAAIWLAPAQGQPAGLRDKLLIGSSGIGGDLETGKEKLALETLRAFIKLETGFDNEIVPQESYEDLAKQLADKRFHLGAFQGFEFAWAREKYPNLRVLAVAVNGQPYKFACVLVRQGDPAKSFADLKGRTVCLPRIAQPHLELFVGHQCRTHGQDVQSFFGKTATPDNVEDALDDLVDGTVQAAVIDAVGLESYRRRKPGRFAQLKELARSEPFPPTIVAYMDGGMETKALDRFRDGLVQACTNEKGRRVLTLFKLTGFELVPKNFPQVLAQTCKAYPPPLDR